MELTSEQRMVHETVREFDAEAVETVAREAEEREEFPETVWDGLAGLDLTSMTVPEAYGGFDVERYYRDAKVTTIYEGTSEVQKKVTARHLRE